MYKSNEIQESVHILNILRDNLLSNLNALYDLQEYNVKEETVNKINHLTFERGIIIIDSYLDEYHKFFSKHCSDSNSNKLRQVYKVIKKKINRFSDIKIYRNNVVAHNLRVNGKNIYFHGNFRGYKVPQTIVEFNFIATCIDILTEFINRTYPKDFNNAADTVSQRMAADSTPYLTSMTREEADEELIVISSEMLKILES